MNNKFFILREFAENQFVSKEKICLRYNMSYIEYDNYLNELLTTDKYLISVNNKVIKITDEGMNYLNNHKVDAAVILASGLGTRMGELTKNTSKCLLTIHNEILIERLITQLQERDIKDIVIIVGHVKEKFEYLKSKYHVKLIENAEYNTKNTIATFHCAINEIKNKNVYITVGDIYLSENLFHTYEIDPYYTGIWSDDCTNEWTFNYDDTNKLYGVNVGGKYDYCMAGFSFHTKSFINILSTLVESEYKKVGTEKYYWEEVLLNNLNELPNFYIQKFSSVSIQEFDTINDLKKINDELVVLKDKIKEIFKTKADDMTFTKINNGLTNNAYLLLLHNKKYIVRLPGMSTNLLIDRKNEKNNYDKLKNFNFTDKLVFFDENSGLKISEYFENSVEIDINNDEELIKSLSAYKKLHSLNIKVNHNVDISNVFKFYLSTMKKYKLKFIYCDFNMLIDKCNEVISFIKKFDRPITFTHGDAGYCNVLKTNNGYKLIDFEFAGMADPITDIALFGFCSNMNIDNTIKLLDIYINCKIENIDNDAFLKQIRLNNNIDEIKSLIVAYMAIDAVSCAIWNLIRITITNKYSFDYGESCIKAFDTYYEYLKSNMII